MFFWITTIVLILVIGISIYINTLSFYHAWIAFVAGPIIMILFLISIKIIQYEKKHGLTHHKTYNGVHIHTSFPMKKDSNKKEQ
ncbi:MAG: hypothetical protein PQJ44_02990 [Sphaerochaetaceae bacterium]|nr:hypothetical protein [Sphaerochaetaceae bacterium]